ncbi:hypothetical protein GOV05_05445 [Candidatus Woesearchaeota archaeon]|nr:hypothetical protein [Candidatus Woesearchaeota archaeon]
MDKKTKKVLLQVLIIFFIFTINFFIRYYFFSQTPYFSDDASYFVLRQAEHISETGRPLFEDPYSYNSRNYFFSPIYHYIISFFLLISKDMLLIKVINNLLAATIVITSYLLALNITKNATVSTIISLTSGFVPVYFQKTLNTLSPTSIFFPILLLLVYFISLLKQDTKKYVGIVVYLLFFLIILSPLSLILILGLLFNQILTKIDGLRTNKKEVEIFIVSFFFYLWYYFLIYKQVVFETGFLILRQNIPFVLQQDYFLTPTPLMVFFLVGVIPFIIGMFSTYLVSVKEKIPQANILASTIIILVFGSFLNIISINALTISLGILLGVISCVGVKKLIDSFVNAKVPLLKTLVTLTLIILVIPSLLSSLKIGEDLIRDTITTQEVETFMWIDKELDDNAVILSSVYDGHLISYFSKRPNVVDSNFLMAQNIDQVWKDVRTVYTTLFYSDSARLAFEFGATHILVNKNTQKVYEFSDLPSFDEACYKEVYTNKKTNDKIYQVIC